METWAKETIDKLKACNDLTVLKDLLIAFRKQLGFSNVLYGVVLPRSFTNISHFIITDYPDEWMGEYGARKYAEIDPIVKHTTNFHEPYCWDRALEGADKSVSDFMQAAAGHGLVGGISIGIHGYSGEKGIFSVASTKVVATGSDEAFTAILYINTLLPYIHEAVSRLTSSMQAPVKKPHLSPRELDCLLWSAEGKTAEEIAQILSITSSTVTFHLKNVIQKLEVGNRNQAIAKAILFGIISPQYSTLSEPRTYLF